MRLIYPQSAFTPCDSEEYFPIVTPEGMVTGCLPRSVCHNGSKELHPVVHLHIFNSDGKLFLQKRTLTKDIQPGKWDTAVGGHIDYGESVEEALMREAREELGISISNPKHLFRYVFESDIERELVNTYAICYEGPFALDPVEIAEGRFWSVQEIKEQLGKNTFTPNFESEFRKLQSAYFKQNNL